MIKISDLVEKSVIEQLKALDEELKLLTNTYTNTARELAKGLDFSVKGLDDLERMQKLYADKSKDAAETQRKINDVMTRQNEIVANTTNTISRQLMEQERVNKTQRQAYTEYDRVKKLLEDYNGTYDDHLKRLSSLNNQLSANSKQQKENEKALKTGAISLAEYNEKQIELIAQHRSLTQEKRSLQQIMTAEEKAMQTADGSYVQMNNTLELLKKAYKDLSAEATQSAIGREMEEAIQGLDAHLKDVAADMGEFQRNVGNYAIAGQKGVVTTESVVAAMEREAVTTQDVIDQTKILEEAKLMLNQSDANYQNTLDAINAKLEENKQKLTDVSDILGKEANTAAEAEVQNKRLQEALKHIDVTSDGAKAKIAELKAQIERNNETIKQATGDNEKYADSLLGIIGVNTNLGSSFRELGQSGNFIAGVTTKAKALVQTLWGLATNPWMLAFLGIAGVAATVKWWYDFNKGMIEASRLTENFTGLAGKSADAVTVRVQTLADNMGKGYKETMEATNTLVQQFGISWEEATDLMQDGIVAGANMGDNLVNNISRFAPALRDAGVSADEFVAILSETRNGIFSEEGVNDIVKGGTRLRAMTKNVAEALDAVSISSEQMQKDLAEGNITMLEAVQQVAGKLKELPENSQEAGKLMKEVFGRTAAQGGTLLIQSIADVNTNLDEQKAKMGELGEINEKQMNAQRRLNEVLTSVFKMSGTSFEKMTTQAKTFVTQALTKIIEGCVDVVNWFIEIYNNSIVVRAGVSSIVSSFKNLWEVAKLVFNLVIDSFKNTGKILEGIFTLNWSKVKEGWTNGLKSIGKNVETTMKNIASNAADAFNSTLNGKLDKVSLKAADITGEGAKPRPNTNGGGSNGGGNDDGDDDKKKKAREKAAKEELKLLQELEASKISMMADGHEKELAMIRLNYKKRLDAIKGNGETENALRLQLAIECQKEIAECELKYQTELAKINLENKLAFVRKGSKEELDLKLAQIEMSRAAELEAAEQTGADVALINKKFDQERIKLEEEYAGNIATLIQARYASEQKERDNDYIMQVASIQNRYAAELEAAKNNASERERIEKEMDDALFELDVQYAKSSGEASIKMLEDILKLENLSAEERLKFEQELAAAKARLFADEADANAESVRRQISDDERLKEKRLANLQKWASVASDAIGAITDLANSMFNNQIAQIEALQEANQEAGDEEIERINELVENNVITQEEGEARKQAAEAETAAKNKQLEEEKAALQMKAAKYQKAADLAQAGINTALAITNALITSPFPLGLAMAAIAAAMGAVQIATIVSTPLPKYAHGTSRHPGGPAIVGDGGRPEVVRFDGQTWLTPDRPTIVDIPEGAEVIPSIEKFMAESTTPLMPIDKPERPVIVNNDYSKLERGLNNITIIMKNQARQNRRDMNKIRYEAYKNSKV